MTPYYQDEYVTIYNGDCKEILPSLGQFDLLLTDPPYGLDKSSTQGRGKLKNRILNSDSIHDWDTPPTEDELKILLTKSKKCIIWGGNYFRLPPCRGFLVWDKMQPWDNFSAAEFAWTNISQPSKLFHLATTSYRKTHPTEKPLFLMSWCISLAGDIQSILDPFAGSGTTGRAAKDLQRKCVLIEREEKYCEIAAKRMRQEVLPLFNFQTGIESL